MHFNILKMAPRERSPLSTRCEAANSPDCGVGDKAHDDKNSQCDEHADYDRRTASAASSMSNARTASDRDQGDADREQGHGDQHS